MNAPTLATEKPTHVRFGVLGFVCALSMITYLDRVCFGSAVPYLVRVLGLESPGDLKWAITAFAFAYAAFEIPSGWWGDIHGPRNVLIRIVLWWSFFTALTGFIGLSIAGLSFGLGMLIVIRFLFGMGEAGAYPNITRALHNWFPFQERAVAQGAVWMAGRMMGGLTPIVWLLLVEKAQFEWRAAFWIFGGMGIFWCVLWGLWFRNRPEQKDTVNAAELSLIRGGLATGHEAAHTGVPWLKLLSNLNLWTLCLMYACAAYGWYFNITYLHTYLEQQHGVDQQSVVGAFYKGGPLWVGALACLAGGWLSDHFIRRTNNLRWARSLFGVIGHGLCALCWFACLLPHSAFTFFLAISMAAFFNDMTMGPAWATCQDIGKKYAAIVAGAMNTIGNLGGAVAGWVTGTMLQNSLDSYAETQGVAVRALTEAQKVEGLTPGYNLNFLIFGAVYVLAAILWLRIDATKPVAQTK
jgi:ACS family glucarate transporter-like MFS transporter